MIDIMDSKAVYKRIEGLREARGWTNYELAKKASISQTAIRHWRDGGTLPSLVLLDAVCGAFEISLIDFLSDGEEQMPLTAEQRELVQLWNKLSAVQKCAVLELLRSM